MISRYCIGKLYEDDFFAKLKPMNYISIATPHVGSRRPPKGLLNPIASWVTTRLFSSTGIQLMLEDETDDGVPLLVKMTLPECSFFKALAAFNNRIAYANISNDIQVPYSTASISPRNPYLSKKRKLVFSSKYPCIIEDEQEPSSANISPKAVDEEKLYFSNDTKKDYLRVILKNLRSLTWTRVAVCFDSLGYMRFLSHEQIVAKRPFMYGNDGVVQHLLDHFVIDTE